MDTELRHKPDNRTPIYTYPFVKGEWGFDFEALPETQYASTYMSESGNPLRYKKQPKCVEIKHGEYMMIASVATEMDEQLLELNVHTRIGNEHHPDFRASEFVDVCINYFSENGNRISGILGSWGSSSTNWDQFHKAISDGHPFNEALFMTWTGKKAMQHGFRQARLTDQTSATVIHVKYT